MKYILEEAEQSMSLKAARQLYWILQKAVRNVAQEPVSVGDKQMLEKEVKQMNYVNDRRWEKKKAFFPQTLNMPVSLDE